MVHSRRMVLGAGAAVGAAALATKVAVASFGNPAEPPQRAVNTQGNPRAAADPGPQNPAIAGQFPSASSPPPTDVGDLPQFWASFNNAPRRIQSGGWARQVTQANFHVSESISGVNMRLAAGGVREMHWHLAAEWAFMSYGTARVTVLDPQGRAYVADVKAGDLWYLPSGYPHSLQGLGPDRCEFILCFDDGKASEFNTLLITNWILHTPPDVLALSFGMPAEAFSRMAIHNYGFTRAWCPARWRLTRMRSRARPARRRTRSSSPSRTCRPTVRPRAAWSKSRIARTSRSRPRSPRRWSRSTPA